MKRLFVLIAVFFTSLQVSAQDKYAILFSRLAAVSGEEKIIARNNVKIIKEGLGYQAFAASRVFIDSSALTKEKLLKKIDEVTAGLRQGDFVFLYFDLPFGIEPAAPKDELKLILDPMRPKEFITISELQGKFQRIGMKTNNPSLFFALFDSDSPPADSMTSFTTNKFSLIENDLTTIITAVSPGEKSHVFDRASIFARAIASSLKSISGKNNSYRGFFSNIQRHILSLTTKQTPEILTHSQDMVLFNGRAIKFLPHYEIRERVNDSTVIINAGQRMSIAPGIRVDFFPAYSDTVNLKPTFTGEVISVSATTAVVRFSGKLENLDKHWAYVPEYDLSKVERKIKFNELYSGDASQLTFFKQLVAELKKPLNANYTGFVAQGGDVQVGNIAPMPDGKFEVTLLNPQTEQLITTIKVESSTDIKPLVELTKKLAQYEYISKLTNYIPELAVDFQMTDATGNPLKEKENGYDILYEGDEVAIKIINNNPHKLFYSLADLTQDKSYTIITNRYSEENVLLPNSEKILQITITAPFGKERVKLFTSLTPFSLGDFQTSYTRSTGPAVSFSEINIQDYDFEARSALYKKTGITAEGKLSVLVKNEQGTAVKTLSVRNPSSERVYFNLFRQKEDGSYEQVFPGKDKGEKSCYADYGTTVNFQFQSPLNPYDQLVTVYADRPFNLIQQINEDKGLNELFVNIAKNGRIPGTALNKIGLAQALFQPGTTTTMRDGESIFIKLITPKVSNDRGITIPAPSQQYEINGFAMSLDNKPVKSLKINNETVNYDTNLKFFEHTVNLSFGVNKVIIEATDEKGFTAVRTLEFELKNNNTVVAGGKGKNYFLGIGIDNYKTWPVLNNAKNDVIKFAELLKSKYGFDSSFLLLDEKATRKNIINNIREFLKKTGPNDNVVIYLSGHGNEDQLADGDYYFIPQEAEADDVTGAVKSTDIVDNFKKIRAKRCLLIVDACYSGMITNSVNPSGQPLTSTTDSQSAENAPCKWIVTSGRATKVSDGEKGKNSPFATVLINYLREHEDDASLKMPRLIDFLKEKVKELSKQQEPFGMPIEGRGEWIFKIPGK